MIGAIETIGIFSPDGGLLINAPVTDNCERNETLMGDEYVSLSFNHEAGTGIPAFSYIEYDGRFYFCKDDYHPQNAGGYYKYEVRFVSASNMLDKFVFMRYVSVGSETWREAEFSINANILTIGTIIVQSIREAVRRLPDCKFKSFLSAIDLPAGNSYGDTKLQALSFSGTDIRSAITTVANTWETECWIEETGTAAYLHFDKCETGDLLTLSDEYVETDGVWKSGGLTECSYASNKNTPVQRIIPYGSERNIIRKVAQQTVAGNVMNVSYAKRLKLDPDTTYNVSYDGEAAQVTTDGDGAFSLPGVNTGVESVEFFDDVYPRETFVVDSVAQKGNQNYPYYTITAHASSGVEPSLPVEIAEGLTLSIIFESGYLNGFEFEVRDDSKQGGVLTLTIIPQTDGDDVQVPIGSFVPKEGDTFAMFNMIMPESYVTAAKQELAQEAYVKLCEVRDTMPELNCQSEPSYFVEHGVNLKVGTRISVDSNLFGGKPYVSRVISYSHSLTTPDTVTFKLCSSRVLSALAAMNNAIADQTNSMDGLYQNSISLSRRGWRDAKELADMLESLAAEMLLVGNEKWQFAISCTISMKNSSGKFSGLQITAGMLQHTQPPYTERENKGVWQMPAATYSTTVISDPDTPYYLYADVSGETSGTWLISADKKDDENHLLVGTISSEFEGQRVFNRTYGYTAITGGKITTEQIQDANRNLIIDFSSNPPRILARNGAEIIGNIKFKSTSGEYKGIEEGIAESIDGIETGTRNLILDSLCDKKIPSLATTGGYTTGGVSNMTAEISDEVLYNGKPTLKIQNKPTYYSNQLYIQFDRYERKDTKLDVADYVFSCMLYVPETYPDRFSFENRVGLFCYNGSIESENGSYIHVDYDPSKKGTWQKLVAKVPYVKPADGATDWCFFRIRSTNSTTQGTGDPSLCCLYIAEIQLVKGNQAGTWTPAPEDAQAAMQEAIDNATTAANNAQAAINSLNSDNIFSVVEKKSIRVEWESISGRADTTHSADTAGDGTFMKTINTAAEVMSITGSEDIFTKYDALKTQLNTYKLYTNSDTELAANFKTIMAGKFADYYDAEVKLMQAVQELYTNKSIDEIEIGGVNLIGNTDKGSHIGFGAYNGVTLTKGTTTIEEFGGITCDTLTTSGGASSLKLLRTISNTDRLMEKPVVLSLYVKNLDTQKKCIVGTNGIGNDANGHRSAQTLNAGEAKRVIFVGNHRPTYNFFQMQFYAQDYDVDGTVSVAIWHIKLEEGNKPTAWSPAPEDTEAAIDAAVNGLGGENLIGAANPLAFSRATGNFDYKILVGRQSDTAKAVNSDYLQNGAEYVFSVGKVEQNAAGMSTTQFTVLLYNFAASTNSGRTLLNISGSRQTCTFTVPATGNWSLLIYNGVNGSTSGNQLTFYDLMLQNGTKATAYQRYTKALAEAMQGTTDIDGGLVLTNLIQLKNAAGAVTAGITGLDSQGQNVFLWCGGTFENALAESVLALIRRDGSGFFAGKKMKWGTDGSFQVGIFQVYQDRIVVSGDNGESITITNLPISDVQSNAQTINIGTGLSGTKSTGSFNNTSTSLKNITLGSVTASSASKGNYILKGSVSVVLNLTGGSFTGSGLKPMGVSMSITITLSVIIGSTTVLTKTICNHVKTQDWGATDRYTYTTTLDGESFVYSGSSGSVVVKAVITGFSCGVINSSGNYVSIGLSTTSPISMVSTTKETIIAKDGLVVRTDSEHYFSADISENTIKVIMKGLPTSNSGLEPGQLYRSGDTLKIMA